MSIYLSGDIGGTKTLLRLARLGEPPLRQKSYASGAYSDLADMLVDFLSENGGQDATSGQAIESACFALAAPVQGRQVKLTNLPWSVDADKIAARFSLPNLTLINDFAAVGYGIEALSADDLYTLQTGLAAPEANRLVVGAGTGLGVAWLSVQAGQYSVHPSEAGHSDFAPTSCREYELFTYLQGRHGHVSYERIVSGPGLVAIYEFLRDTGVAAPTAGLEEALSTTDAAAAIAQSGLQGESRIADMALTMFVEIYGAFVGNMALAALPRGGIYIAGGIAGKILARLQGGEFRDKFLDKGRFTALLREMPLHVVLNPQIGLLGAERFAARMA